MQPSDHKKSVFDRLGNPIEQNRHRSQYGRPVDWRFASGPPPPPPPPPPSKRYSSPYQPTQPLAPLPHIPSSTSGIHHPDEYAHQSYYYSPQFRLHDARSPHAPPMPGQPPMPVSRYDRYNNLASRHHQQLAASTSRGPPSRWHENVGAYIDASMDPCPNVVDKSAIEHSLSPQGLPKSNRWRERRDAISNLDLQTAQSMSKTNSLKSSMQLHDLKRHAYKKPSTSSATPKETLEVNNKADDSSKLVTKQNTCSSIEDASNKKSQEDKKVNDAPADISDGEIVDDTSDEEAEAFHVQEFGSFKRGASETMDGNVNDYTQRKRRRYENEENLWELENISDDDLDDLINDKDALSAEKSSSSKAEEAGLKQASSEAELLKSIGIDWLNLVQMAKQSKRQQDSSRQRDSARLRFSLPVYLPELGISSELAGPELYEIVSKITQCN